MPETIVHGGGKAFGRRSIASPPDSFIVRRKPAIISSTKAALNRSQAATPG